MSNYNHRLRKLEPSPHLNDQLEEVNLRLMRYAIEWRHLAFKDGPPVDPRPAGPGGEEFENIYANIKTHPRFAEMLAEVEAGHFVYVAP